MRKRQGLDRHPVSSRYSGGMDHDQPREDDAHNAVGGSFRENLRRARGEYRENLQQLPLPSEERLPLRRGDFTVAESRSPILDQHEEQTASTRETVACAITSDPTVEGSIGPDHRYLAVFIFDDDTQPFRQVISCLDGNIAMQTMKTPPEGFFPEYLIDLDGPLFACVLQGIDTGNGSGWQLLMDGYLPFDQDHIAFA